MVIMSSLERGILLLDKPEDLTSMQCVEVAKRILKTRKAGHSGTLDPKVTGLMLIAFNEATKAMPVLLGMDKGYEGVMTIHGDFRERELAKAMKSLTGKITQTPPRKSAVVRKPRERLVQEFEVLSIEGRDVRFTTLCQAGTYVRMLCHDTGLKLGVGAHMASLRRVSIGPFSIEEAFTMDQVRSQGNTCLFPLEQALERIGFPVLQAGPESLERLRNGIPLDPEELGKPPKEGLFGIADIKGSLNALARLEAGKAKPERILLTRPQE